MDKPILEKITPAKAEQYLNRNTGNRKLRDGIVEKYAADMRDGHWTECLDPIAFYENGDVADGQHRLWAIIESNTTQEFIVVRNFNKEAGLNIDVGLARTLVDNARISGLDTDLSNELISVVMAVDAGDRPRGQVPNAIRLEVATKHKAAAKWALAHGPRGKSLRNQCTLAAVARAWYHEENKEMLARFGTVVSTGMSDGMHESAAIALRNYLLSRKNVTVSSMFRDTFLKVQNAIHYFVRGKSLTIIKTVKDEQYPLPRGVKPTPMPKRGSAKMRKSADTRRAA